jgi:hypothetical protein
MLEAYAERKWGGQVAYENYKSKTSVLIPKSPSGQKVQPGDTQSGARKNIKSLINLDK